MDQAADALSPVDRLRAGEWVRAIYCGLPMEIRQDPDEPDGVEGRGFFSEWMEWLPIPFNGKFFLYDGGYWPALWSWLTDDQVEYE